MKVRNISSEYQFVGCYDEVNRILELIGADELAGCYGALFVKAVNGDFVEVLGISSAVPWLHLSVDVIKGNI